MKLRFSLATLLICVTVLAIVAAICAQVPVTEPPRLVWGLFSGDMILADSARPPTIGEIVLRLGLWGPVSVAAVLFVLWRVRHLRTP
jgi:hypothetical protein